MKDYKNENIKLIKKLSVANKTIRELKSELSTNKKYWTLYLFELVQTELEKYNFLLNPLPIQVHASEDHKPLTYLIKPTDVICVIANKKKKDVYLKSVIKNIEGVLYQSDIITVNRGKLTMSQFCLELDNIGFHLVQISRSVLVNVACYHQNKKKLHLLIDPKYSSYKEFEISPDFINEYQKKKNLYDDVLSLQRIACRGKEKK